MSLLQKSSIFGSLGSISGVTNLTIIFLLILLAIMIVSITHLNIFQILMKLTNFALKLSSKFIHKRETNYHRDLAIGKINEKRTRVKIYRFLNDLTIDLGLKQKGATPYEFLFIVAFLTLIVTVLLCRLVLGNYVMVLFLFPILLCGVICTLYTKANIAHDRRIEAIIEAENIICNNINAGVLVAVKNSINVIPTEVRGEFRDFIDNIESKNFHVRTALLELNNNLGSVADDFIKKCIVFEMDEEVGLANMFKDVVEINNIKMTMRIEMKRRFEEVTQSFIMGAAMIIVFLGGVIAIYEDVRTFYFTTVLGQIIICLDMLILILEFVYITYLKAKDI